MAKSTVVSRIRALPTRILVGMVAIIFLIGAIAGFGLGVKVEHDRKPHKAVAAAKVKKTKKKGATAKKTVTGTFVGGRVTKITKKRMNLAASGGVRKIVLTSRTVTFGLAPGVASQITPGSRVMYKPRTGLTNASEVVLLAPQQGALGNLVTATGSNTIVLMEYGKAVKVDIGGAVIRRAAPGSRKFLRKSSKVFVLYRTVTVKPKKHKGKKAKKRKSLVAYQIIQLPTGSNLL